jgi:hypothetical protein
VELAGDCAAKVAAVYVGDTPAEDICSMKDVASWRGFGILDGCIWQTDIATTGKVTVYFLLGGWGKEREDEETEERKVKGWGG